MNISQYLTNFDNGFIVSDVPACLVVFGSWMFVPQTHGGVHVCQEFAVMCGVGHTYSGNVINLNGLDLTAAIG